MCRSAGLLLVGLSVAAAWVPVLAFIDLVNMPYNRSKDFHLLVILVSIGVAIGAFLLAMFVLRRANLSLAATVRGAVTTMLRRFGIETDGTEPKP